MFDSLRRGTAHDGSSSRRLRELADSAARAREAGWIDESDPPPPRPPWLRAGLDRWLPGRRLPVVLAATLLAAACAVVGLLVARPQREQPPALPPAAPVASERAARTIVVSVVGRVAKPGLVTLPDGARVADAVNAVGGVSDVDALGLNLAQRLSDGEQVHVGVPAAAQAQPAGKPGKLDLNSAGVSQLDDLPGVGEVTAQRIVDWRAEHGRFTAVEQLRQVDGIGAARFARLKDLVTVR